MGSWQGPKAETRSPGIKEGIVEMASQDLRDKGAVLLND